MNSKERFICALKGQDVDRVPVMPKIWVDAASRLTGRDLFDVISDPLEALYVIARAGKLLGLDAVRQFQFPEKRCIKEDDTVFEIDSNDRKIGEIDIYGGLATHLYDSRDFRIDDPRIIANRNSWIAPEPTVNSLDDAKAIAVPDSQVFDELGWGKRQLSVMESFADDLCFIGNCSSATMAFYISFRGMNNALMDLVIQPELVHAVMERGAQTAVARGKYWLDLGINVLRLNDSAGNMSLISPQHWKEFIYPYIKHVCDQLHSYNQGTIVYCHICGNVIPVMDLLVEAGIDCIGPLDPLGGFTVAQAREKAGSGVSLMGGIDTSSLLRSTPEEVKRQALECIKQAGTKGGYILSSGCAVPRDCPKENLLALVEASKEKGK